MNKSQLEDTDLSDFKPCRLVAHHQLRYPPVGWLRMQHMCPAGEKVRRETPLPTSRGPKQWTHTPRCMLTRHSSYEFHLLSCAPVNFGWCNKYRSNKQLTILSNLGRCTVYFPLRKKNTSPNHSGQKSSMLGSMSLVFPLQRLHRNFSNTRQWPAWICECWMLGTN